MKILFGVYPWAFDCPGGGERQLLAYKKHLEDLDIQVDLYDQWNPRLEEYDIFHFFSVMPGSYQLCNYIKGRGLKLFISPNLWVTEETKYDYPHESIKELLSIADKIIVNSILEAEELSKVYNLDINIFSVIYNGVEKEFFNKHDDSFLKKYNLEKESYILNVANIEPRKNQLNFLKALKKHPSLKFVTIGHIRDEEYYEKCKNIAGNQLKFIGPLDYNSELLKSAYENCNFFAMPSTLETPSIAALEAAASGSKVLITGEGSTKEYFKNLVKYVDPFDIESMENELISIISKENCISLKNHILEFYRWNLISKKLLTIYKSSITS